jgi:hypothetical protein
MLIYPHDSTGPIVESFDLTPIVTKRLRVQGSTLRSRSTEYQAKLITRSFRSSPVINVLFRPQPFRFKDEVLDSLTDESGDGPVKVYVHKARATLDCPCKMILNHVVRFIRSAKSLTPHRK